MKPQRIQRKIGNREKALIHVAKSKLGLTDDIYRDILYSCAKVESSIDLTHSGFLKVLKRFRELGFRKTGHQTPERQSARAPVTRQKWYDPSRGGLIEELADAARERWGEDFEKPLNAFINSHLKIKTHYKFLNVTFLKGFKERIKEMNIKDKMPGAEGRMQNTDTNL